MNSIPSLRLHVHSPRCAFQALVLTLASNSLALCQQPAPPLHFTNDQNGLYADGRWVSGKTRKGDFPSETQINCDHVTQTCVVATAEYYAGHPHVSIEYFRLLKWDENGLIATDSDPVCVERTLLVSFPGKTVSTSGAPKNIPKVQRDACQAIGLTEPYTDIFILKNSPEWNSNPYGERSEAVK